MPAPRSLARTSTLTNPSSIGYAPFLARRLDPAGGRANEFAIGAAALTAFDPAYDRDGRVVRAAMKIVASLMQEVSE